MSRTNPNKLKRRSANTTLLVFGEGMGEEMFVKHLKKFYSFETGVSITVRKGKGGNAISLIIDAANLPGAYDKKIVVLDNDKNPQEMDNARLEASNRGVGLIEHVPCLEAILLQILTGTDHSDRTSADCKSQFEEKYIAKNRRSEPEAYDKHFSKNILDSCRSTVRGLDTLIKVIEGRY